MKFKTEYLTIFIALAVVLFILTGIFFQSNKAALDIDSLRGNNPTLGRNNSPVNLVVFMDFNSPYSKIWWSESYDSLGEDFVGAGDAQLTFLDFPNKSTNSLSLLYAMAGECANEQDKWVEMYEKIFNTQYSHDFEISPVNENKLKQWATEIDLDNTQFSSCYDSKKYLQNIEDDLQKGIQLGFSKSPSVLIVGPASNVNSSELSILENIKPSPDGGSIISIEPQTDEIIVKVDGFVTYPILAEILKIMI